MDYAKQLWDLSNAITAFAVVQALAFAYAFKDSGFPKQVHAMAGGIKIGVLVATLAYVSAIFAIGYFQVRLVNAQPTHFLVCATEFVCGLKIAAVLSSGGLIYYLTWLAGKPDGSAK
jgi:hypothetical protein